ncbi:hypothetical protein [Cellulomonas soli]|uniref:Uncharacterized protein n=1 Tax=Cellulomonas soli TaxID=931535 RepID=A0A512PBI1_9CELL|nr:hypothetical protein [Cellulomonas soli]NYI61111.1 lambda repressor-like predicted transcriptional regulator [Cellulomonas soli]GEP68472.1 hypothetical protein CSO01_11870 [Cellulomonas soli]
MSIGAVTGTTSYAYLAATTGSQTSGTGRAAGVPGHIETAAETLGLSTDEVMSALDQGQTLADLAEAQGVSKDDLVAALVADAPEVISATGDVESFVTSLVEGTGQGRGPAGPPPPPPSGGALTGELTSEQQTTFDALADLLGTDSESLLDELQSGTSLLDMLDDAGVSYEDLAGAVQSGLLVDVEL